MAAKLPNTAGLTKRALIDKANTTTVAAAAIAAFLVVFCLVSGRALLSQAMYQNRVISAKKDTLKQLNKNLEARDDLVKSYEAFVGTSQNVIGGNPSGSGDRDGDNAKIVLDALPSKYDFPALASSLEKLAGTQGLQLDTIVGTDDEVAQAGNETNATPVPVPMDFEVTVKGAYQQVQGLTETFEKSIRPIQVQKIVMNSTEGNVSATITAQTFYQPEKKLELRKKVVK
jgi:hypothetical protein